MTCRSDVPRRTGKPSKYANRRAIVDGIAFDSKKEAKRYAELRLLERAGAIRNLERQVKFELIPSQRMNGKTVERACNYIADFAYEDGDGHYIVEDVKGYKKGQAYSLFSVKRKLMLYRHGIQIKEV